MSEISKTHEAKALEAIALQLGRLADAAHRIADQGEQYDEEGEGELGQPPGPALPASFKGIR